MMRYGSVCSGLEAATVAWHPLGWMPAFFSEIEAFPRAVLKYHYPDVPCHGDFTTIQAGEYGPIDLLVGGTPCQSFSVAGLRGGMADERGNLALEYLRLAARARPRWMVWENVPGVLSSNGGRDFGAILGGMVELGYGIAYRVLDAQYFGVPQRRRRVFVVGYLGDWRRAAAVLFECHSLSGDSPPRRQTGEAVTGPIAGCSNGGGANGPGRTADDADSLISFAFNAKGGSGRIDAESETFVTHSLRADGFDASEDGTGRGTPLVPVAFAQSTRDEVRLFGGDGNTVGALAAEPGMKQTTYVAFSAKDHGADAMADCSPTLRAGGHSKSHANAGVMPAVMSRSAVRRLLPVECERLQGFPDDFTKVPYRGKPAADGPRYKALGNSMAVPVMRWIGERIAMINREVCDV